MAVAPVAVLAVEAAPWITSVVGITAQVVGAIGTAVGVSALTNWALGRQSSKPSEIVGSMIPVSKAYMNAMTLPEVLTIGNYTTKQAIDISVQIDLFSKLEVLKVINAGYSARFASKDELDDWTMAVNLAYQNGFLDSAATAKAANYYGLELARLAGAVAPAAPPIVPAAAPPAAAAAAPLYRVGDTFLGPDAARYVVGAVLPGPPIAYNFVNLSTGATGTIQETHIVPFGFSLIVPGAVEAPPAAAPAVPAAIPAAPAAPAAAAPGVIVNVPPISIPSAGELGSMLTGVLPLAGTGILSQVLAQAQNLGHGLASGRNLCLGDTGQRLLSLALPGLQVGGIMAFLNRPDSLRAITDPITRSLYDTLLTFPEIDRPIEPHQAPQVAESVFLRAVGLGISAHLASQASEAFSSLKFMGLPYFAAMLADMAGFGRIAAATMGVMESQSLALPMRYYVNAKVRSTIPGIGDLNRMSGEYELVPEAQRIHLARTDPGLDEIDKLNRQAYYQWAKYHGYSDMWIDLIYDAAHNPAGERLLRMMADQGIWDETYYRVALLHTGYDLDTTRKSMEMLRRRAHGELRTIGVSTVIQRYKVGLDDDPQFMANLQQIGVSDIMLPKYQYMAQLEADYDDYQDYLSSLKALVAQGAIEPDAMEGLLIERGVRPDKARLKAQREAIKLIPKPKAAPAAAAPSRSDLTRFLKAEIISEDVFKAEMIKIGYSAQYIAWYLADLSA